MMEQINKKRLLTWVLFAGLLTGTIDAMLAILINYKVPAFLIFKFIASGVFGTAAFTPGNEMVYYGILFHYCIAFSWTIIFFLLYSQLLNLVKFRFIFILLTGFAIWLVMNLIVLPLSQIHSQPQDILAILTNIGALVLAFGLPITLIADKFHETTPGEIPGFTTFSKLRKF